MLVIPGAVVAQESSDALERLHKVTRLECKVNQGTQAIWESGRLNIERSEFGEGGTFVVDSIDLESRRAQIAGNVGRSPITALPTGTGIILIEMTPSGNMNFTTVFGSPLADNQKRFIAVQSRHSAFLETPMPSQYHGTCQVAEEASP